MSQERGKLRSHILSVNPGDYVLASLGEDNEGNDSDLVVLRCEKVNKSKMLGIAANTYHWKRDQFVVMLDRVVSNLGNRPIKLTVAATNLYEVFDKRVEHHPVFGAVNFSYEPNDEDVTHLMKGYSKAYKWLKEHGLADLVQLPMVHEVTHIKRRYVGQVKTSTQPSVAKPTFVRFCTAHEMISQELGLFYVVMHELAHVIDLDVLLNRSPKLTAAWLDMFERTVKAEEISEGDVNELFERLIEAPDFKSFRTSLTDEDAEVMKIIASVLSRTRSVSLRDLAHIKEAGDEKLLNRLWPVAHQCVGSRKKPVVSDYATKNVRELFAESVAFYAIERKLPKEIVSLVEASLSRAAKLLPHAIEDAEARNKVHEAKEDQL